MGIGYAGERRVGGEPATFMPKAPENWKETGWHEYGPEEFRALEQAGLITPTPLLRKELDRYFRDEGVREREMAAHEAKMAPHWEAVRTGEEAEKGLAELQERATLTEAGGDPLKSQLPTK